MRYNNRLIRLLIAFFATIFIAKAVHALKPEWDRVFLFFESGVILTIGALTMCEMFRIALFRPSAAMLALSETQRQQNELLRQEAFRLDEERRLRRNARQRERRAALRGGSAKPASAPKPVSKTNTKVSVEPPKSRWDRLLDDDEE